MTQRTWLERYKKQPIESRFKKKKTHTSSFRQRCSGKDIKETTLKLMATGHDREMELVIEEKKKLVIKCSSRLDQQERYKEEFIDFIEGMVSSIQSQVE